MNEKAKNFLDALENLCIEYGVQLSPSGYDSLQVWDWERGDEPIYCNGVQDMTKPGNKKPTT